MSDQTNLSADVRRKLCIKYLAQCYFTTLPEQALAEEGLTNLLDDLEIPLAALEILVNKEASRGTD